MDTTFDGGPAFPVSTGTGPLSANFVSPGMSLRDWFAGMALQEVMSNSELQSGFCHKVRSEGGSMSELCARAAYAQADAMLDQRETIKVQKSLTPNLDYLRDRVNKLKALLDDPHPGLATWVQMYGELVEELMEFWRKNPC